MKNFREISPYIRLMRPWQWVKNLLVFAPLFFAVEVFHLEPLTKSLLAFTAFCLVSSLIYVVNDIYDRDQDKLHPTKKNRPIASGETSVQNATVLMGILAIFGGIVLWFVPNIIFLIILYVVLNVLYSLWFKHTAVLDVIFVSIFYIIRLVVGGIAAAIYVSPWIILCVLFGSLFVIVGKRRAEFYRESKRKVLNFYSVTSLDFMLGSSATLAIISYGIWTVIGHNLPNLVYSVIFVIFALFKLLNNIYMHPEDAESPELMVFKDRYILFSFILWALYVFVIFYARV